MTGERRWCSVDEWRDWLALNSSSRSGLVCIKRPSRNVREGSPALASVGSRGYYHGQLMKKTYLAHRVVFFLANGFLPKEIDHIDGNQKNNLPENLRAVTRSENQHNRTERGVYLHRKRNRYQARIQVNGKQISLGYYDTYEDGLKAYLDAKKALHPSAPERCYK